MKQKYAILLSSSAILFSSYYCYDIPAALNRSLSTTKSIFNTYNITELYSIYAFPNIFVPLLLTIFFKDSIKPAFITMLSVLILIGHTIFSFALNFENIYFMLFGRFIFGLGNETLFVLLSNKITENYKRNISLALSIFISLGRLGIVANFIFTPIIAKVISPFFSCIIGIILLSIAVIINLIFNFSFKSTKLLAQKQNRTEIEQKIINWEKYLKNSEFNDGSKRNKGYEFNDRYENVNSELNDRYENDRCENEDSELNDRYENEDSELNDRYENDSYELNTNNILTDKSSNEQLKTTNLIISPTLFPIPLVPSTENVWKLPEKTDFNILNQIELENETMSEINEITRQKPNLKQKIKSEKNRMSEITLQKPNLKQKIKSEKNRMSEINYPNSNKNFISIYNIDDPKKKIHGSFYLMTLIAFFLSFIWAPFYNLGPLLLQSKFNIGQVTSSQIMGGIEAIQMIFFIISGYLADFFGGKFFMIFFGCFLLTCSYFFMFLNTFLYLTIFLMSLAAPLHGLYWSLVSNLCSVDYIPIAFSLLSCQMNLSFTIAPIIYSYLIKKFHSYDIMVICSLFLTIIVNLLCFLLSIWNKNARLGLNKKIK
ncbi:hypothetical protein M153_9500012963 [Pseudoloma neurophilia]|uniref:Lysosomal dipeptide transporter MFSD1 n=1 Tax=Pseudoloma neurophilia TaxID=146866 RepID=A0A0R0M9E3_9MICR|nr:hypothetical protein M153_9500012963 [Pseudoloma neurophilia]